MSRRNPSTPLAFLDDANWKKAKRLAPFERMAFDKAVKVQHRRLGKCVPLRKVRMAMQTEAFGGQ